MVSTFGIYVKCSFNAATRDVQPVRTTNAGRCRTRTLRPSHAATESQGGYTRCATPTIKFKDNNMDQTGGFLHRGNVQ